MPWYNTPICSSFHDSYFEYFLWLHAKTGIHWCLALNHMKMCMKSLLTIWALTVEDHFQRNKKYALKLLFISLNFIEIWLKLLESNYAWTCIYYQENTKEPFQKIPTTNPEPTPEYFKNNRKLLLTSIGEKWCVKKYRNHPPLKNTDLIKKKRIIGHYKSQSQAIKWSFSLLEIKN